MGNIFVLMCIFLGAWGYISVHVIIFQVWRMLRSAGAKEKENKSFL